jgi:hypothetical protein
VIRRMEPQILCEAYSLFLLSRQEVFTDIGHGDTNAAHHGYVHPNPLAIASLVQRVSVQARAAALAVSLRPGYPRWPSSGKTNLPATFMSAKRDHACVF